MFGFRPPSPKKCPNHYFPLNDPSNVIIRYNNYHHRKREHHRIPEKIFRIKQKDHAQEYERILLLVSSIQTSTKNVAPFSLDKSPTQTSLAEAVRNYTYGSWLLPTAKAAVPIPIPSNN